MDFNLGQHWNLGDDKIKLSTTSSTFNYDKSRARFANLSLGEKKLNSIKNSNCKFGFSDNNFSSTYSSAFKPLEKISKFLSDYNDKDRKTKIIFSNNNDIEKKTIYKTDFINRDLE
jgi:hypothetical protein